MDSAAPHLLQLPPDLLRRIWDLFKYTQADQVALRNTCAGMARATTPFISTLTIGIERSAPEEGEEALIQKALATLQRFPHAAKLSTLRWSFQDCGDAPYAAHHVMLPALLPSFVFHASDRLAMLEVVELSGQAVVTSGELFSLANACRRLKHFMLDTVYVCGPVFTPLSCLPSLTAVRLFSARALAGSSAACVCPSLSQLSRLTQLHIASCDDGGPAEGLFHLNDVVPHISCLTSLCTLGLHFQEGTRGGEDAAALQPLTALTRLTSFGCTLNAVLGADLLLPTRLASLSLDEATLSAAAIRTVASLPHLLDLRVGTLDPGDIDLSGLKCSWRTLALSFCASPYHLVQTPLHSLTELCFDDEVQWTLNPTEDAQLTTSALLRATQILAGHLTAVSLLLDWAAPCVPPRPHILSGLAPLRAVRRLNLTLGRHWQVDAAVVHQLEQHLPSLQRLAVYPDGSNFARFAAALGAGMALLRELMVWRAEGGDVQAVESVLLVMAGIRARSGSPLYIHCSGMDAARRSVCNAVLSAIDEGVKFGCYLGVVQPP